MPRIVITMWRRSFLPSLHLWHANDSTVRRIFMKFVLHKMSSNCESQEHQFSYNHTLITAANKVFTLISILLDRFNYNLMQNIFTSCRWINASLRNDSSCFALGLHYIHPAFCTFFSRVGKGVQKVSSQYGVARSFMKISIVKAYCTAGPKWICVITFHNYCPIWVYFGTKRPLGALLSVWVARKNVWYFIGVNRIALARVPRNRIAFWK